MKIFAPTLVDFYKTGHLRQYPSGTEYVYSNFTCRSDRLARVLPDFDHKAVFFGLQGACRWLLRDCWNETFFRRPKGEVLSRYARRMDGALGPGAVGTEHLAALHDLGYLPLLIKALPEGSRVPMRVPMFTMINTRPEFYWLTNYVETQLSAEVWKTVHSATIAHEFRRLLDNYATRTGSPAAFVPWQGHDFSARGMSGVHDAATSGAAHLLSFTGTDTVGALDYLEEYYDAKGFIGGSVPATEHSVMCMGGEANELGTFRRLICDVYPSGVVSIVSDTWDFWRVLTEFAPALKAEILNREPNALGLAKVVFRPDSGDPVKIVAGDPEAPAGSPERLGAVGCLWETFGGSFTATGSRLLNERVGVIYGDNITLERAAAILKRLDANGFASANVVFGIGSFTYQFTTRDSFGCAIKATWGVVNGKARSLFKTPATGDGTKNSARGLLRVNLSGGDYSLAEDVSLEDELAGELRPVFCDGQLLNQQSLSDIRARLS